MMPDRSPQEWRPTARWQAGRIFRLVGSLVVVGFWVVFFFGGIAGARLTDWLGRHFVVLWVLGLLFAVGGTVLWHHRAHRRRHAFKQLADERGWQLTGKARLRRNRQFTDRWSWLPLRRGQIMTLLTGEYEGYSFAELDYRVRSGSDDGAQTFGVTTIRLPAALPRLQVSPERIASGLVPGSRFHDVDVESEAFNRRYRVQAEDRRYAVDVLNPRTVAVLLSAEPFRWRIDGPDLIAFGPPLPDWEQILDRLRILATIANNIPSFVWRDRGELAPDF